MRDECKVVKRLLSELYPNIQFKIQFKSTNNYVFGSDSIIVKCPEEVDINDIIIKIRKWSSGISVFKNGMISSNNSLNSKIIIPSTKEEYDMNCVNFIKISEQ